MKPAGKLLRFREETSIIGLTQWTTVTEELRKRRTKAENPERMKESKPFDAMVDFKEMKRLSRVVDD